MGASVPFKVLSFILSQGFKKAIQGLLFALRVASSNAISLPAKYVKNKPLTNLHSYLPISLSNSTQLFIEAINSKMWKWRKRQKSHQCI